MDENKNLTEVEEAVAEVDGKPMQDDELKEAITKQLEKIRNENIIVGYRVACKTVIDLIAPWHQPKCSKRELERILKKLEEFCSKALKQDTKETDETTQN